MSDYWIFEHDEEVYREHLSKGFFHWFDMLGGLNIIDAVMGETQMLVDSRSRKRRRGDGRVRFILPRTAVYTDGVNQNQVTRLLSRYGIRSRRFMFDNKNTYFTVRGTQSAWAVQVLDRWKAGTLGASWKEQTAQRKRERKAEAGSGFWGRLGL